MTKEQDETDVIDKPWLQKLKFTVDILLKLSPVFATVILGMVAYQLQSRSSAANLLSQREQAETELRATLFQNLLGPIGGSPEEGRLDPERQRLFVELLMLNFHDHIEFKPLLVYTDKRLSNEIDDEEQSQKARRSLQSVTRRVRDRQLAILAIECRKNTARHKQITGKDNCSPQSASFFESDSAYGNAKVWKSVAPDKARAFDIRVLDMDWENLRFKIELENSNIEENKREDLANEEIEPQIISFNITPFDLPFTDNMFVGEDHRLALGVSYVAPKRSMQSDTGKGLENGERYIEIKAMWFPKNYILPNERPVNYKEIRDLLDVD